MALALRLSVARQPMAILLVKNVPDDAFYYFILARNMVQSGSASLDGVNLTSGFHPLWLVLLMPVFGWSAPLGDLQVHLALSLACGLEVISVRAVGQIAAQLTQREDLGLFAAGLYAANPVVILQATNGLETALGMATVTLFWWLFLGWLRTPPGRQVTMVVGDLGGLMFLLTGSGLGRGLAPRRRLSACTCVGDNPPDLTLDVLFTRPREGLGRYDFERLQLRNGVTVGRCGKSIHIHSFLFDQRHPLLKPTHIGQKALD